MTFVPAALAIPCLIAGTAGCRATPDHSALDAAAARELVRSQAAALHDLSADVSLSISTEDFDGSLSGALVVEPPARLRLRTTKVMQDIFDLVVTPEELDLYWFRDRILFRRKLGADGRALLPAAPATPPPTSPATANEKDDGHRPESFLARMNGRAMRLALANFELPPADAASAVPPADRVVESRFAREGREFVVRDRLGSGEALERRYDGRSLFLRHVTLSDASGATELRAEYDDHELIGGMWLPTDMVLEDLVLRARFRMSFHDVAVNEGALPGAFTLAAPPGAEVRDL